MTQYRNPPTTADIIIQVHDGDGNMQGIVLIKRKHEPFKDCWALPGGFQEIGESIEQTAIRESKEETNLEIKILDQFKMYSNPDRDPRGHVNSVGFVAKAYGIPKGGDDAYGAKIFPLDKIPKELAFDHGKRIKEYLDWIRIERELMYYPGGCDKC